jgi:hypothetical protein
VRCDHPSSVQRKVAVPRLSLRRPIAVSAPYSREKKTDLHPHSPGKSRSRRHGPSPLTPTFSFENTVYTLDGARLICNVRPIFERKARDATIRPQFNRKWWSRACFCADRLPPAYPAAARRRKASISLARKDTQPQPAPPSLLPAAEPAAGANAPVRGRAFVWAESAHPDVFSRRNRLHARRHAAHL